MSGDIAAGGTAARPLESCQMTSPVPPTAPDPARRWARRRRGFSGSEPTRAIEARGIEPVPGGERRGRASDLFAVRFAASIGILVLVLGAILSSVGLSPVQAVGVAVVAITGSFLLVGVVSVAGTWSGMPALSLSRRAFGLCGNLGPAGVSWVSIPGREIVTSVIAGWAVLDLGRELFGLGGGRVDHHRMDAHSRQHLVRAAICAPTATKRGGPDGGRGVRIRSARPLGEVRRSRSSRACGSAACARCRGRSRASRRRAAGSPRQAACAGRRSS